MNDAPPRMHVLAVHPTSRGFGWVLFDGPFSPVDWGTASARPNRSARLLARFKRLVARYEPAVLVIEDFEQPSAKRSERVRDLCRSMLDLAAQSGVRSKIYPKHVVHAYFGGAPAATRHQIAEAIATQIDDFSHRLPKKRKPWDAEDPRQSLFDAAALAIVHYAKEAAPPPRLHPGAPE
jgi:Holliday junction resolvasome RuvABC endonuclease subunit